MSHEWDEFDTWCIFKNVDSFSLYSRRLVNVSWEYLTRTLNEEQKKSFLHSITDVGNGLLKKERKIKTVTRLNKKGEKVEKKQIAAPPPGWKSDKENYANIQGFLGMMGNVSKAVHRGGGE